MKYVVTVNQRLTLTLAKKPKIVILFKIINDCWFWLHVCLFLYNITIEFLKIFIFI